MRKKKALVHRSFRDLGKEIHFPKGNRGAEEKHQGRNKTRGMGSPRTKGKCGSDQAPNSAERS